MYYNVLKDRVSYFKENKEGVAIMCRAIEEIIDICDCNMQEVQEVQRKMKTALR